MTNSICAMTILLISCNIKFYAINVVKAILMIDLLLNLIKESLICTYNHAKAVKG
jgi:hypothetical protein